MMSVNHNPMDWLRCLIHSALTRQQNDAITPQASNRQKTCLLLMNGPGLAKSLAQIEPAADTHLFAVNQFAETEHFPRLRPAHFLVQDHYFWDPHAQQRFVERRDRLFNALGKSVDWPMSLYIPGRCNRRDWLRKKISNDAIRIVFFHSNYLRSRHGPFSAAIQSGRLLFSLWQRGWLIPPPENVLIGALYLASRLGYGKIVIVGADFSFFRELQVDQLNNRVCLEVRHFYGTELRPMHKDKADGEYSTMAHEMAKWARAFRLFEILSEYLHYRGVEVVNASHESFIDAFPRGELN